ncbi:MAG: hypothetical protein HUU55_07570 [Myxococcales bacterium]|nr:hypothetical protein [Myxococcales bacterium]
MAKCVFLMLCFLLYALPGCATAQTGIAKIEPPSVTTLELEHEGATYVAMTPEAWGEVQSYFVATDKQYATTVETLVDIIGAVAPVVNASANLAAVIASVSDAQRAGPEPAVAGEEVLPASPKDGVACATESVGVGASRPEH